MLRQLTLCAVVAAALALPAAAMAADTFAVDPAHTQTIFTINHLGYSMVTGGFHDVKGTLSLDQKQPAQSSVEVTIGATSIDTGVPARDDVLRSKAFFDVADFPAITFKSTRVDLTGKDSADVQGGLTILGVTKPVVLKVKFNRLAPDQMRNNAVAVGFTGTTTIKRSDFGMKTYLPYIGDDVSITVNFEGLQQVAPARWGGRSMQWRSTTEDWGVVAKFLHWAMAVCIMLMIVMGIAMRWFLGGDQALQYTAYQLHKSFGFLLLLFALARLLWRLSAKAVPAASFAVKAHERWLASGVHAALYVAMFGMPISGLLAVSASPLNVPTVIFGLFTLPRPIGPDAALATLFSGCTSCSPACSWRRCPLHVAGAIWHRLVLRDGVLERMAPGGRRGLGASAQPASLPPLS